MKTNVGFILYSTIAMAGLFVPGVSVAGVTNVWDNVVAPGGNTPATAYLWSSPDNWQTKSAAAVPTALGDGADLGTPASVRFVQLPADLGLTWTKWGSGNYLLGDLRFGEAPGGTPAAQNANVNNGTILFGNFYLSSTKTVAYVGAWTIAGYFNRSSRQWGRTGNLTMRMDLWADSSSSVRTAPFLDDGSTLSNGPFTFYGPRGAPAQSGTFAQTDQSPYVKAVSMVGKVAPGSQIVADGIPVGTFVKYVFGDSGWLQLSQNATKTLAENVFSFTAITPSVEQTIRYEQGSNAPSGWRLRAIKYRDEDGLRLVYPEVKTTGNDHGRIWGLTAVECQDGWVPGDVIISNVSWTTAFVQTNTLYTARLEVPNVLDGHWVCGSDCDSRLTVPAGRTGGLLHVRDFKGKLEKCGAGTLQLGVDATVVPGSLKVTEGRAKLSSTIGGQALTLDRIELAAGATLEVPAVGLNVSNLVAAAGSRVCGPGKLTVLVTTSGVPVVCEGAELAVPATLSPDCVVSNGRWMHLDATKSNTLVTTVENGTNFVSQWNDVHGGSCSARACGQGQVGFGLPWIRREAYRGMDCLDLGPVVSNDGGAMNGLMRCLQFYNGGQSYSYGASGGTLAAPYIHAAFIMAGSEYGGGALLSSAGNGYSAYGFSHTQDTEFKKNIFSCKIGYSEARIANYSPYNATFRINGVAKIPNNNTKFSGGWDVFTYAIAGDYMKSGGLGTCNVGFGNLDQTYDSCYGGLLYGEVILYTQALTSVQIDNIDKYLRHKWRGEDFPGCFAETTSTYVDVQSKLSVVGGGAVETSGIGGGGTIDGDLVLDEDGTFNVVVGENSHVPTLTVTGKATLPEQATVVVSGLSRKLRSGDYPILAFGSCAGDISGWAISKPDDGRRYSLVRDGNTVVLNVLAPGMTVIVR